ncbi:MAG: putative methyltransferase, partial [Enterobacterales bacterium]
MWILTLIFNCNIALFNAIKPGGHYLIIDHNTEEGSNILFHPGDSRDYNVFRDASTKRDQTDRFVFKFYDHNN